MRHWLVLSAAFLLTSCIAAGFQFGRLDNNDDERISRKEAADSEEISAYFGLFDKNEDGYLDAEEFENGLEFIRASDTPTHDRGHDDGGGHRH